jgi:hypothetical protein
MVEEKKKIPLTHVGADVGYCRVYYRAPRGTLFCLQDEGAEGGLNFLFYVCTQEEEPLQTIAEEYYTFPLTGAQHGVEAEADMYVKHRGLNV